ncbi:MAG: phosphoribosyltransferase family protein [Candidatus Gottesmanbacteria bacterium]|nr:phosphoribosyltransferase family protein [Candidatus Gottesmanbacteria bacterium]
MKTDVISILKKVGAILTDDHFVYTSGKHGSVYINKDAVYPHTKETSAICKLIAQKFLNKRIEVVAAPALGGIILSQWTAHWLSRLTHREVLGVYTEKDAEKNQIFTRGYERLVKNKRVLVIEDLTTTGGSVRKVVDTVKASGGKVVAVAVMVNRDPLHVTAKIVGAPFWALGVLRAEAFDQKSCPLCKKGIPVNTTVGHGKKYVSEKKAH